jgi:hypothetical protein
MALVRFCKFCIARVLGEGAPCGLGVDEVVEGFEVVARYPGPGHSSNLHRSAEPSLAVSTPSSAISTPLSESAAAGRRGGEVRSCGRYPPKFAEAFSVGSDLDLERACGDEAPGGDALGALGSGKARAVAVVPPCAGELGLALAVERDGRCNGARSAMSAADALDAEIVDDVGEVGEGSGLPPAVLLALGVDLLARGDEICWLRRIAVPPVGHYAVVGAL